MVEEQTGDKVTDQAAEEDDKSARMAAAESEWQDKYLRLVAEFDNYRKRTLREKMDLIASGGEDVIKSLLTVMDDIDRALDAMSKSSDIDSIRQGIVLIHQKLLETLHAKGVEEITAIGKELDTDLHLSLIHILYYFVLFELDVGRALGGAVFGPAVHEKS